MQHEPEQQPGHDSKSHDTCSRDERLVYCLCIDLIASTEAGLRLPTRQFDAFNKSLVEQITPHLERLELGQALLKFTGDGWLLMTNEADASTGETNRVCALCCLATIMSKRFQQEMSEETGIPGERIPPLRISICAGRDIRVTLPNGREDWLGDSARRAVRAADQCSPNEVLVDGTIRTWVLRDFSFPEKRAVPAPVEEAFDVWVLGKLRPEIADYSGAPEYYVYTLEMMGKTDVATAIAQEGEKRLLEAAKKVPSSDTERFENVSHKWNRLVASIQDPATANKMVRAGQAVGFCPDVVTYNMLMAKAPDYDAALQWLETMRAEGVQPDVWTYNTLAAKTPDYDAALKWLETMRVEGVQPDVVTYNTLVAKTPDYDAALKWLETMRVEGVHPNVVTYSTLVAKTPDYDAVLQCLETMRAEGVQPNVVTYNTLVANAPDYDAVLKWVETMRAAGVQPNVVTYNTLVAKAPDYDTALQWLETMQAEDIQPNVLTYSALFSKDLSAQSAEGVLDWYLDQPYHPEGPIQAAIAEFRKKRRIDQALRLVLGYAHLPAARRVIREYGEQALSYFLSISEQNPDHPNADYALGVALMELGRLKEARPHLEKALELATADARKVSIEKWLQQIDDALSDQNTD